MCKEIKVICPVYNQFQYTEQMLYSLNLAAKEAVSKDLHVSILLVDNGSPEPVAKRISTVLDTVAIFQNYMFIHPPIEIITNKSNKLFSAAVNQGLRTVYNQDVIILNNDTFVDRSFFLRCHEARQKYHIHGPVTNKCAGMQNVTGSFWPEEGLAFADSLALKEAKMAKLHIQYHPKHRFESTRWANGFCLYINNEVLSEIGLLNEEEFPLSGEEIDYCYRAFEAGFKIGIDRWNFVWHYKGQTVKSVGNCVDYWRASAAKLREKYKYFPRQAL